MWYFTKQSLTFEWDEEKNQENLRKHKVPFEIATQAFYDQDRIISLDFTHSDREIRYFCFGKIDGMVMTVRFTYRENAVRIIGAGYWRKGKKIYEIENKIHR